LPLGPGSYFALFAAQGNDVGFLLANVYDSGGLVYLAGMINLGVVNLDSAYQLTSVQVYPAAVRIQGALPATGPPTNREQCKNGGWMTFTTPRRFNNQGDCIQFVNTGR
jgi:hypothetical protein